MQKIDRKVFAVAAGKECGLQTIECGFTLKRVRDMTRTYSQMHRTDKYHNTAQSFSHLG